VLGSEVTVAERARLLHRSPDHDRRSRAHARPRARRHRQRDKALLGGLLGHAEHVADLCPRSALGPRSLDIAIHDLISALAQVPGGPHGGVQALER